MPFQPDILLTRTEKENLSNWENLNEDFTLSRSLFLPFWKFLSTFIPHTIAPNVITLSSFLCILNGFYLCVRYGESHQKYVPVVSYLLAVTYQTLNGIDSLHATKTRNQSNLGHLFSRFCSNCGIVFQALTLCYNLGIMDLNFQWYIVQIMMLMLLLVHLRGFKTGIVRQVRFLGGNELLTFFQMLLFFKVVGILDPVFNFYEGKFFPYIQKYVNIESKVENGISYEPEVLFALYGIRYLFYTISIVVVGYILMLPKRIKNTRNHLLIIMAIRLIPGLLIMFNVYKLDLFDVVCDGLFISLVVSDLIVSKLCKKEIHSWIIVFAIASSMSHSLILIIVSLYFVLMLSEVAMYLNVPILAMNVNVYVDGVYDLCHYGHFKYFERALGEGTRLLVGVLSDEDVMSYKRRPVMTMEERVNVVRTCKAVYKVIPRCPYPGIPKEFIKKYNIHKVLCSVEYDKPDDHYYAVPREMKILKVMPRTEGMSTSELIRRINRRKEEDMLKKQKLEKEKEKEKKGNRGVESEKNVVKKVMKIVKESEKEKMNGMNIIEE